MSTKPYERLKQARIDAGYESASDFADALRKAGKAVTDVAYRHHENNTRSIRADVAALYAPLLKVAPEFILYGHGTGKSAKINEQMSRTPLSAKAEIPAPDPRVTSGGPKDRLKVMGMAECGPDGWALWNGDVIDLVDRPAQLAGAPRSYAVFVIGESMEPAHWSGRIAYVHPDKPIEPGCDVLIQIQPPEGESTPRAFIKHLVKRSGDKVIVKQWNPAKTFTLKRSEILSMHRVLGSLEA